MSRDEVARLPDIQAAIEAIESHRRRATAGADNALARDAVLHQLVVIGEAVKHLAPETKARDPGIAWADIAGLRDLIAHEYFRIDSSRIEQIVDRELPTLREVVGRLLADL